MATLVVLFLGFNKGRNVTKRRILGVVVLLEGLSSSESGYLSLICNDLLAKAIVPVLASKATKGGGLPA